MRVGTDGLTDLARCAAGGAMMTHGAAPGCGGARGRGCAASAGQTLFNAGRDKRHSAGAVFGKTVAPTCGECSGYMREAGAYSFPQLRAPGSRESYLRPPLKSKKKAPPDSPAAAPSDDVRG